MRETRTGGMVVAILMFPSLDTRLIWPVSAQARLQPVSPIGLSSFSRRALRAAMVSVGGSSVYSIELIGKNSPIWLRSR